MKSLDVFLELVLVFSLVLLNLLPECLFQRKYVFSPQMLKTGQSLVGINADKTVFDNKPPPGVFL